jgi:hypothetical protein
MRNSILLCYIELSYYTFFSSVTRVDQRPSTARTRAVSDLPKSGDSQSGSWARESLRRLGPNPIPAARDRTDPRPRSRRRATVCSPAAAAAAASSRSSPSRPRCSPPPPPPRPTTRCVSRPPRGLFSLLAPGPRPVGSSRVAPDLDLLVGRISPYAAALARCCSSS